MPSTDKSRQAALNAAAAAASKALKEKYQDEWNGLMKSEAADRGEEWSPRPTAEQRAEEEFQALLKQFPHLAEKVEPSYVTEPVKPSEK